jgi:aquaporin Z
MMPQAQLKAGEALRAHWPEYVIEAWALGMFMLSAALFSTLFGFPGSPLQRILPSEDVRRAAVGIAMGLTAIGLIYSPWGQRSGAHMNPAVTLTFWRLGKIARWDAIFYMCAQFLGGVLGVLLAARLLGEAFTTSPVRYVTTVSGMGGPTLSFIAEFAISALLMSVVLRVSNSPRYARYTGLCAGTLVAIFIALEAPYSGMSMNPARSFASALPAGEWHDLWVYFTAPVLGMLAAAALYVSRHGGKALGCAKLQHPLDQRCIHCGYVPPTTLGHESTRRQGAG